jgi:hypothetical protein
MPSLFNLANAVGMKWNKQNFSFIFHSYFFGLTQKSSKKSQDFWYFCNKTTAVVSQRNPSRKLSFFLFNESLTPGLLKKARKQNNSLPARMNEFIRSGGVC